MIIPTAMWTPMDKTGYEHLNIVSLILPVILFLTIFAVIFFIKKNHALKTALVIVITIISGLWFYHSWFVVPAQTVENTDKQFSQWVDENYSYLQLDAAQKLELLHNPSGLLNTKREEQYILSPVDSSNLETLKFISAKNLDSYKILPTDADLRKKPFTDLLTQPQK